MKLVEGDVTELDWSKATVWDCDDGYHCICLDGRHIESAESLAALQAFQSQLRAANERAERAEREHDVVERKGQELCAILGNLLIHVHELGLRYVDKDKFRYRNERAEAAEAKLATM